MKKSSVLFLGTETWEKLNISGLKPQPRSESVAFAVSELLLKDGSSNSLENKASKIRARTCSSADRGNRHSSYFPSNRIAPCEEKTYVFNPSQENYTDGSEVMQGENNRSSRSILQVGLSQLVSFLGCSDDSLYKFRSLKVAGPFSLTKNKRIGTYSLNICENCSFSFRSMKKWQCKVILNLSI